jgi:hypothetical protein
MSGFRRSRLAFAVGAIILSVAVAILGLGAGRFAAASDGQAIEMSAGVDTPSADPCSRSAHDLCAAVCSAMCMSLLGILPSPALPSFVALARMAGVLTDRPPAGHSDPPEPYPPKPSTFPA